MKKGDIVYNSGLGKTENWLDQHKGIVTKVTIDYINVIWDNTVIEDQMGYWEVIKPNPHQILKFSDGINIFTGGILRVIKKHDGFYVVGHGNLIPVKSKQEGLERIHDLQSKYDNPKISLNELVRLNQISIGRGYNRNFVDDFDIKFEKDDLFTISPLLVHNFKCGIRCEPHVRCIIHPLVNDHEIMVLDLPFEEIWDYMG
jgi:hypothetical protein